MEFDTRFNPQNKDQYLLPARYAYFRDGALYVMGGELLSKESLLLNSLTALEKQKALSTNYAPFMDAGAPLLEDGALNKTLVETYGLKIPAGAYLVLGDNHANSGDSREFGFVPEGNLRGGPSIIFWPPGSRMGRPNQPIYPFFKTGRVIIWIVASAGFGTWYAVHKRRHKLPLDLD